MSHTSKEDILAGFMFRHACKEFDPGKKISEEDFRFILETGRLSPSSFGFEPWKFVVIQNPQLREELKGVTWGAQKSLPTASHFLAILCLKDAMRHDSDYILNFMQNVQKLPPERIEKRLEVFKKFQESDFKLLEDPRYLFDWACKQAYIALANMMSSAALIGIDSCPIEGYDQKKAEEVLSKQVLSKHKILEEGRYGLAVMAAFGYRVNPQPAKTRQNLEDITSWIK